MNAKGIPPVLILGGYGSLGSRTARALRRRQPELGLTIAGRDITKAAALADELRGAEAVVVDLGRADLGLAADRPFAAVVTAVRDHSLNTMRFAQQRGVPYVALSDAPFEIGPLVARHVHRPSAAAILLLGHSMGATPALAALGFAREFARVDAIEIGLLFDPLDPLGAMSATDMERIASMGPPALMLADGRWRHVKSEEASREFVSVDGSRHVGHAVGLQDVLSLSSITTARTIRVDVAEGPTATSRQGLAPSHEVIIEITGQPLRGAYGRYRYELVDPEGYAAMSARSVALCVERLLGLGGGAPPKPGLYLPELLVDFDQLRERLEADGVHISIPGF